MCILNAINCSSHSVQDDSLFPTASVSHIWKLLYVVSQYCTMFHPLVYINHVESLSHSCNILTSAVLPSEERRQGFYLLYFVISIWDLIINLIVIAATRAQVT